MFKIQLGLNLTICLITAHIGLFLKCDHVRMKESKTENSQENLAKYDKWEVGQKQKSEFKFKTYNSTSICAAEFRRPCKHCS